MLAGVMTYLFIQSPSGGAETPLRELAEVALTLSVTLLGFVLAGFAVLVALFDKADVAEIARTDDEGGLVADYFPFWFTGTLAAVSAAVDFIALSGVPRVMFPGWLYRPAGMFIVAWLFLRTLLATVLLVRLVAEYGMVRGALARRGAAETRTEA